MGEVRECLFLWYALLNDHGLFSVRSKNTLTKAILFSLKQLQSQPEQIWGKKAGEVNLLIAVIMLST